MNKLVLFVPINLSGEIRVGATQAIPDAETVLKIANWHTYKAAV